jgi:hypothetical protein
MKLLILVHDIVIFLLITNVQGESTLTIVDNFSGGMMHQETCTASSIYSVMFIQKHNIVQLNCCTV